jgi:hypothetical protein
VAARWLRGGDVRAVLTDRWTGWRAVLVVYIGGWQVLILWKFPKAFVGWFPSFAPLVALLLGVGFARLLTLPDLPALAASSSPRWSCSCSPPWPSCGTRSSWSAARRARRRSRPSTRLPRTSFAW